MVGVALGIFLVLGACNFGGGGGDNGDSGQPTAKWFIEKGPPSNSQGANGDLYLDTDAAVLYVKTNGQWQAAASVRGSGWLFGAGAPASTLGSNGDLYLDTSTSMAYRKLSGAWSALFALKGDTGTAGTQWYSGTANPTSTVPSGARAGDYYFQTSTAMIYRKDASGNWSSVLIMASNTASFVYTPYMMSNSRYDSVYFNGIAYGNGTYIAVGNQGTIIRSTDGAYWKIVESTAMSRIKKGLELYPNPSGNIADELIDVAFGNGIFLAVGHNYVYVSSDNGLTWSEQIVGTDESYRSVSFLNGKFFLTCDSSSLFSSSDCITWAEWEADGTMLTNIAYGNGKYLVFAHSPYLTGVCTSTNGTSWTYTSLSSLTGLESAEDIYSVVFGNGLFVAVGCRTNGEEIIGTIWISTDGTNWSSVDLPIAKYTEFSDVAFGNGFAVVGFGDVGSGTYSNYLASSSNGIAWNLQSIPAISYTYNSFDYPRFASITYCMPRGFAVAVGGYTNP